MSVLPSTPAAAPELAVPAPGIRRVSRARQFALVAEGGQVALVLFGLAVIYGSQHPLSPRGLLGVGVAGAVWIVALRSIALPGGIVLGRAVAAGAGSLAGFVVVAALNASPVGLALSFPVLLAAGFAVFCSAAVWGWFVDRTAAATRRVLLVGSSDVEAHVADELRASRGARFDLVGSVPSGDELAQVVEAQQPDIVVLTDEGSYGTVLERLLDARANVRVAGLESFCEYAFGRVPIDQIDSAWFMSLLHPRQRMYTRSTKRAFDVAVALTALVLLAPLMAVLAVATRLTGAPILYRQTRLGEGGRRFQIYKFRTMCPDAESGGATYAQVNDPRATRLGCLLRRTHLDELPQLWNVLRGDMSVVGPRPERPEFVETIEAAVPFWNRRLLVKPGVTGWAQLRSGYASEREEMQAKLSYDLWYVRHGSLLVDLAVCAMTFSALFGRGAR